MKNTNKEEIRQLRLKTLGKKQGCEVKDFDMFENHIQNEVVIYCVALSLIFCVGYLLSMVLFGNI